MPLEMSQTSLQNTDVAFLKKLVWKNNLNKYQAVIKFLTREQNDKFSDLAPKAARKLDGEMFGKILDQILTY